MDWPPSEILNTPLQAYPDKNATQDSKHVSPLQCKGNFNATLNNMKLVHWP